MSDILKEEELQEWMDTLPSIGGQYRFRLHSRGWLEVYGNPYPEVLGVVEATEADLQLVDRVCAFRSRQEDADADADEDEEEVQHADAGLANAIIFSYCETAKTAAKHCAESAEKEHLTYFGIMGGLAFARAAVGATKDEKSSWFHHHGERMWFGEHVTIGSDITGEPVLLYVVRNEKLML